MFFCNIESAGFKTKNGGELYTWKRLWWKLSFSTLKMTFCNSLYLLKMPSKQAFEFKMAKDFLVPRLHYPGLRFYNKTRLLASMEPLDGEDTTLCGLYIPGAIGMLSMNRGGGDSLPIGITSTKDKYLTSKISHMPLTQPSLLAHTEHTYPSLVSQSKPTLYGCVLFSVCKDGRVCKWMESEVPKMDEIAQGKKT